MRTGFFVLSLCLLTIGCTPVDLEHLDPNDCWIFFGNIEIDGRIIESDMVGKAYVRRGNCTDTDIATATRDI